MKKRRAFARRFLSMVARVIPDQVGDSRPGITIFLPHAEERGTRVSKHLALTLRDAAPGAAPQGEGINYPN
jgi:hypothetical protein